MNNVERFYREWLRQQGAFGADQYSWIDRFRIWLLGDRTLRAIKTLVDWRCPGLIGISGGKAGERMTFVRYAARYGVPALIERL